MNKFFAAIGTDDIIYGIGTSEAEAITDAVGMTKNSPENFATKPITKEYYRHIEKNGFMGGFDAWRLKNGEVDFLEEDMPGEEAEEE